MVIMTNNKQPDALRLIEELGMPHQDGFHEVLEETICELSWQHQRIAELEAKLAQPTEHTENALDMVWSVERMAYVHGNDLGASRGVGVVQPAELVAITDAALHAGMMALLQCSSSELEGYSPRMYAGYQDDVRRVLQSRDQQSVIDKGGVS
jgi:hypothetical protein